jgi:predicted nucleic acid-binding protein
MASPLYLDTSVVLRACLEGGTTPDLEARVRRAPVLVTSRLSLVETSRAFHRLRQQGQVSETALADAERETNALWARCQLWELTAAVCEAARNVAPRTALRSLDALHLATFVLARQRIAGIELLTVDDRLRSAALAI